MSRGRVARALKTRNSLGGLARAWEEREGENRKKSKRRNAVQRVSNALLSMIPRNSTRSRKTTRRREFLKEFFFFCIFESGDF